VRVLYVVAGPYPSPQGSQVYARGMARAVAATGAVVSVACYAHGVGPDDPEVRTVRAPRPPGYARTRSGPDPVKPALDLALAARIAAADADVVHAHGQEGLAVALAARALPGRGAARRAPLLYSPHTLFGEELPTYVPAALARVAGLAGRAADRSLPGLADACVALSARTEAALREAGARHVVRVPPGVDPADFDGVRPRRAGPGRWVVYAGNPDAYQDTDVLLAAIERVHREGRPDVRLLVVTAAEWSGRLPAGTRVVRTTAWPEARDWIAGADVAALPRAVCAGFPIKLLNYAALGLRTVIAEGSAQGLTGEVRVPDRDVGAFASALGWAVEHTARLEDDTFLRTHAWSARAAALTALYRALAYA
jgi:glycosyltransferase involved in cell wall biosynthesis